MPPRRSSRQSAIAKSVDEVILISSSDDDKVVLAAPKVLATSRLTRRRTASSLAASAVSSPMTARSSRTSSTYASGSHTPATSVEEGDDSSDDVKHILSAGPPVTASPPVRPSRSASLKTEAKTVASPASPTTAASDSRKRKAASSADVLAKLPKVEAQDKVLTRRSSARGRVSVSNSTKKEWSDDELDAWLDQELGPSSLPAKPENDSAAKGKAKAKAADHSDDALEDFNLTPRSARRQPRRSAASSTKLKNYVSDSEGEDPHFGEGDYEDDFSFNEASSDEEPLAMKKKPNQSRQDTAAEAGTSTFASLADMRFDSDSDITDEDEDLHLQRNNYYAEDTQYETEKQRKARLRSEKHQARLKKKDTRTRYDKNFATLIKHHPQLKTVWEDLQNMVAVIKPEEAEQPSGLNIKLLPFQREGLYWMIRQEQGTWKGGMLADEMGMGKTIQMISLMLSDRKKPCLVVAPTVAIMQWRNEIEQYTTPKLKVLLWHGANRTQNLKELQAADVVLTSYAVLESSFRKQESGFKRKNEILKEKSALHAIHWRRIILDEAHNIKERSTNTAKGAFALQGDFRWCLSGTPLQNRVGELYSMIRFLGGDPFAYYFCKKCPCKSLHWSFSDKRNCDMCGHTPMHHTCYWNNEILKPIQRSGASTGEGRDAFRRLRILLERMMLRRTKLERADDMGLPPRTIEVRRDLFNEEEEDLYTSLYTDTTRKFSTYLDQGTVLNNYSNIFTLLTRMRQLANHPDLVLRSKTGLASKLLGDEQSEIHVCRICTDEAEDAIMSRCKHIFCRECVRQYLDSEIVPGMVPDCPYCHATLSIDLEAEALEPPQSSIRMNDSGRQGILSRLDMDKWRSSTKIEALVEELTQLRSEDKTIKSLVFSQFVNFLDLIAFRLQRAGFQICRLEGNMSPEARNRTIKHFMESPGVTVFLVSLKAGGVALNLTEASRVYLMDPWWNPSVEVQAMDRIHRLGQHRPIIVKRMVIENSIESRIIELQNKKSAMIEAAIGKDEGAMGRLSVSDLRFLFTL
ncbi:probable RAD16 - nucleotide excision repair protein [Melanopsichium pennsylvanicum]|uniref:Probable RAD16 - nucleotide excision repair protein n=2 Tax=Melanopsichium pennsylvanicum TaxID=63383 RepID=A0AAJ5C5W7_9BASI|nr:probable RAD16-nucleotide excision repair protein [Melanopsichium pennsylvanicum 4]SNX84973.1 probable RAD16 - nucleotide excision repair protein [Melanopsichium pennsylvanicum]